MGEHETTITAPVMATVGRRFRLRGWGLAVVGVVALVLTPDFVTWSVSSGYGGVDADDNWIDNGGRVVDTAPVTVEAVAHTAPAALVALLLVVAVGLVGPPTLARFGRPRVGEAVRMASYIAVPVVIAAGVLVYTVWQSTVVMDQIQHEVLHPQGFPWGGVTVTTGHMTH